MSIGHHIRNPASVAMLPDPAGGDTLVPSGAAVVKGLLPAVTAVVGPDSRQTRWPKTADASWAIDDPPQSDPTIIGVWKVWLLKIKRGFGDTPELSWPVLKCPACDRNRSDFNGRIANRSSAEIAISDD